MEAGAQVTHGIKVHFEKLHVQPLCFYEVDVMGTGAWERNCHTSSLGLWQLFTIVTQLPVLFTEIKNG